MNPARRFPPQPLRSPGTQPSASAAMSGASGRARREWLTTCLLLGLCALWMASPAAWAHPGSGIAVDGQGQVYFLDTGVGLWKVDAAGQLQHLPGAAFHWLALDPQNRFASTDLDRHFDSEVHRTGSDPTVLLSSDFPLALGKDGALYYPKLDENRRLQVIRLLADGTHSVLTTLPSRSGQQPLHWLTGLAAGPDGSLYAADDIAVYRIDAEGHTTVFAQDLALPDCTPLAGSGTDRNPGLRGLSVAADGSLYIAASACGTVLLLKADQRPVSVYQSPAPWSPTAIATTGDGIYILEYLHKETRDRREWLPRVLKRSESGSVQFLAGLSLDRAPTSSLP